MAEKFIYYDWKTNGAEIRSTSPFDDTASADNRANISVIMHNWSAEDDYTVAYRKRINYWLERDTPLHGKQIVTQGTLYFSINTGYLKNDVSYSVDLEGGIYRLYMQGPGGEGYATGRFQTYRQ